MRRFSRRTLAALQAAKILGVKAGARSDHRFIGIWVVVVDGRVYLGDEDGDVVVMMHGRKKEVLAEMNMGSAVYGTVVPANGTLYVMNRNQLYAIAAK